MVLAHDEIEITVDGTVIFLRPTLRAAMRLERKHGGFDKIVAAIFDGSFTAMADVIEECAERRSTLIPAALRDAAVHGGLASLHGQLAPSLVSLVFSLAGVDQDEKSTAKPTEAAKITFAEFHERLFKIATGWLDWTPQTAWNATPAEITAAYAGKIDMLKAIHGAAEKPAEPEAPVDLGAKVRATFRSIGTKKVRREAPKAA